MNRQFIVKAIALDFWVWDINKTMLLMNGTDLWSTIGPIKLLLVFIFHHMFYFKLWRQHHRLKWKVYPQSIDNSVAVKPESNGCKLKVC